MNNECLNLDIWGRNCELEIIFDCFEGESLTAIQEKTFEDIKDNYKHIFDDSFSLIKEYCLENYSSLITDNFENIFRYIKPKQIYIKRSITKKRIAGILCSFRFDIENGLAVYIEEGKAVKVGTQDIIL